MWSVAIQLPVPPTEAWSLVSLTSPILPLPLPFPTCTQLKRSMLCSRVPCFYLLHKGWPFICCLIIVHSSISSLSICLMPGSWSCPVRSVMPLSKAGCALEYPVGFLIIPTPRPVLGILTQWVRRWATASVVLPSSLDTHRSWRKTDFEDTSTLI